MKPLLVILLGPTGVGKTATSIEVALHFGTEIISCDSRQIFKELRIGTAVPEPHELQAVKHHCIQHKSIHDSYNAGRFEVEANNLLDELFKKHNIVVMTGGSMLYIDAVCTGMDDFPIADLTIRQQLKEKWQSEGLESIQNMLKELDPDHYAKVDLQNPKRILKALEVSLQTGIPYSKHLTGTAKNRDYDILKIGLNRNRDELYNRINLRVDAMLAEGLETEARSVHQFKHLNSLNTVGYKQFFDYFDGITDYQTAVELIKRDSRRYARRQLSWFNRDKTIKWFEPQQISEIIELINNFETVKKSI